MIDKIEVGEYIRTRYGEIGKLQKITIEPEVDIGIEIMPEVTAYWLNQYTYVEEKDILKHSKNIIDLIEVGDYVNGYYVSVIEKDKDNNVTDICYEEENEMQIYSIEDIKSIVTHQQFKKMEYKV